MEYIYKLIIDGNELDSYFFSDANFGAFLFTQKTDIKVNIAENVSLNVDGKNINIVDGYSFKTYILNKEDGQIVYAFARKINDIPNLIKLTIEDLDKDSTDEITDNLSRICRLPNGNFVVGTVQDYITSIEELSVEKDTKMETFFRGHYSYKFYVVPSLYRKKKYYENENEMYMDFKTHFYNELSNKKYIEILTTMQHFRMPTRLLDTTSNPLVALYMACDKPSNYKAKGFDVGEVITMNTPKNKVKYSDSNATILLSALSVLETHFKQELYEKIVEAKEKNDPSIYRSSLAYKRYVGEVKNELPSFDESFFDPEVLLKPKHVKVGMINERIIAQSGNFILFGLCNYETGEYVKLDTVSKRRIFVVNRDKINKQLEMLNIYSGTMYPDKDHMSIAIMKKFD